MHPYQEEQRRCQDKAQRVQPDNPLIPCCSSPCNKHPSQQRARARTCIGDHAHQRVPAITVLRSGQVHNQGWIGSPPPLLPMARNRATVRNPANE
jgi:hypothetical protein